MNPSFSALIASDSSRAYRLFKSLLAIMAGTLVLAISSYIAIPMVPVPITLQTLAVVLIGAFYGWRLGGITIIVWLLEGAAGLPVFSNGTGGFAVFFGPTAGYLLAFPLGGALAGWLTARGWNGNRPLQAFSGMLMAQLVCLIVGAVWLSFIIGVEKAWYAGFLPFLIGALVKAALATLILVFCYKKV